MYAEVAVNSPVQQSFHYHIPPELEGQVQVGHLVQVAFGTSLQHAIVLALSPTSPVSQTKPVDAVLDPRPVVTQAQINLARWMATRYLAPIGSCLWLMLPSGLTNGRDLRATLLNPAASSEDPIEERILALLRKRGGTITGRSLEIAKTMQGHHWRPALDALAKSGAVLVERILATPRVRPRIIQTAALAIHPDQIAGIARHLGRDSRPADLLAVIDALPGDRPPVRAVLEAAGAAPAALKTLVDKGWVVIHDQDGERRLSLTLPRYEVEEKLIELRQAGKPLHILKMLAREAGPVDVSWVYAQTGANLNDLKRLEEEGLVILAEKEQWRDSLAGRTFVPASAPPLTPDQAAAWETIQAQIQRWGWGQARGEHSAGVFLLHGVTGSGKTELYLRAIELTVAQGRGALFLVPEIALTAQTLRRVAARFPNQVAVVHSGLSEGERYDTWRRAREGLIPIVVGARSALFTPLPDIGLVILDEEHDDSYKQSQSASGPPFYHARDVAEQMMRANKGVLLLGSATPDVETFYRSEKGTLTRLTLPTRIMGHRRRILEQAQETGVAPRYYPARAEDALAIDMPPVTVVDMRRELKAGNKSIFSRPLQEALKQTLDNGEQAILFLNRRGASTYVFCRDCGYVANCPRCDTPLIFHREGGSLRCHRCAYQSAPPRVCPTCGSDRIRYFGAGTQQIEAAMKTSFPEARLLRWDADTAGDPLTHELFLSRFASHESDVLIGTQMVAKGLDLPLVTLVGVISADTGLNMPDFRAGERSFQLLTQVAGRAGRGLLGGRVVLQTYQPEHYAVMAAAKHDFSGFYAQEIAYRRQMGYPPFRRLARIVLSDPGDDRARTEAENAAAFLRTRIQRLRAGEVDVIGPAPCFFSRVNRIYRWHVLLRAHDPAAVLRGIDIPKGWHLDLDPVDLL